MPSAHKWSRVLGLGDIGKVTGNQPLLASNDAALLTGSWWTFVPTVVLAMLGFVTLISFGMDENESRLLSTRRWRAVVGEEASEAYTPVRLNESSSVARSRYLVLSSIKI